MASEEDKLFNINIYSNKKDQIMNASNSSTEYIILLNEKLQGTVNHLICENKVFEHNISNQETELDKAETTITYMRGLLKNFVEIRKHEKQIMTLSKNKDAYYKNQIRYIGDSFKDLSKTIINIMIVCFVINMVLALMGFISTFFVVFHLLEYAFIIEFTMRSTKYNSISTLLFKSKETFSDKINMKMKDVKKLEDAMDYLDEYIDCL